MLLNLSNPVCLAPCLRKTFIVLLLTTSVGVVMGTFPIVFSSCSSSTHAVPATLLELCPCRQAASSCIHGLGTLRQSSLERFFLIYFLFLFSFFSTACRFYGLLLLNHVNANSLFWLQLAPILSVPLFWLVYSFVVTILTNVERYGVTYDFRCPL